jgi:hypothetical protein
MQLCPGTSWPLTTTETSAVVGNGPDAVSSMGRVLSRRTPDAIMSAGQDYLSPSFLSPDDSSEGTSTVYRNDDDVYMVPFPDFCSSSSDSPVSGRWLAWSSRDHGEDPKMPKSSD